MRALVSVALALGCLLALAGPALAATPAIGSLGEYPPGTSLNYRLGGATYPAAIQSAIQTALTTDWANATYNNARTPRFSYSAAGSGQVIYSSSTTSPCNTGNMDWLQCASGWGSQTFRIYIRNLAVAKHTNWTWCNLSFSGTCWDVKRALMHEAEHVTLGVGNHDSQGESYTVMGSVSPWYANTGWSTHHIQRCDKSAAQLFYGMLNATGPVADCFESVAGHGSVGLIPTLSTTTTSLSVCRTQTATLAGVFRIATNSSYRLMSGQVLGGRTVWFDRKLHTATSWTPNVASATTSNGSWTRGFTTTSTTAVTYDFRAHTSSEAGLDAATSPVMTVTWKSTC